VRHSLKHVAERAGVSVKTVSNVVNGYPHVRPETRARVEEAIAALDYRPNLSARNLRRGRTGLIALAVPELDNPYFAELTRHVVTAAAARGWTVLVDQTDGDLEREREVAVGIRDHLVDGLILSPLALSGAEVAGGPDPTPTVLIGEHGHGAADHVMVDNVAAAREATAYLAGLGRTRIAAIGAQDTPEGASARLRLAGYRAALAAAGLTPDPSLIVAAARWHRADGAAAIRRLFDGIRPDAVFCFNDALALGALRALHDLGLRVPQDVAVVGYDGVDDGRYSVPSLTTVEPDIALLARRAVDLLAERVAGGAAEPPREHVVPHRLRLGESA
jgi:DNA-binding LacI/PurR family transcriptional regulator